MNLRAEVEKLSERFVAAWNTHDMQAFGAQFHPDATFVNRIGQYWRGRERIVDEHQKIHSSIYRDTTISNRVDDVDPIGADAAIVHILSTARMGPSMPQGPRELKARLLLVLTRRESNWLIQAGHNVALAEPTARPPAKD